MRRIAIVAAVATTLGFSAPASAQSSLFGSNGPIGQGGTTSTPTAGGSSAFGRSSTTSGSLTSGSSTGGLTGGLTGGSTSTSSGGGLSGGGQSGLSGSGLSGNGLSGTAANQTSSLNLEFGSAASTIGQNQFIGRNSTNGLVGNTMAGQQNGISAFFQGLQGFQNSGGRNGNNRSGGRAAAEKLTIRPAMRIGFDTPATVPTVSTARFTERFADIVARRPALRGVNVEADESGRVLLRGTVDSEGARDLAAAIVRLEPGVRDVVNELEVADSETP